MSKSDPEPANALYIQYKVLHTSPFWGGDKAEGKVMEHVCSTFIFMVRYCHFGVAPVNISDGKPETPYPL